MLTPTSFVIVLALPTKVIEVIPEISDKVQIIFRTRTWNISLTNTIAPSLLIPDNICIHQTLK